MEYTVQIANEADLDGIQDLLYPGYFQESTYNKLTYDHESTRGVIKNWLENVCFVGKSGDEIVAVVSMYYLRSFYKEPEADIEMFYIRPDFRGTGLSRDLVNCIVQNADANGCKVIYTGCASGINRKNDSLYANLFKKFGFSVLGTELARVCNV